jgi:predicted aspartyl protease
LLSRTGLPRIAPVLSAGPPKRKWLSPAGACLKGEPCRLVQSPHRIGSGFGMSRLSQGPGWWIASHDKRYPPHLFPTPPELAAEPRIFPGGAIRLDRTTRCLLALIGVLVLGATALPLLASNANASTRNAASGHVVPFAGFKVPTYRLGCTSSESAVASVTSVPMNVVRSGAFVFEFVPVCIDDQGPFPFILDTGASRSVVDTALARVLSLPTSGPTRLGVGVNCSAKVGSTRVGTWAVGPVPLAPQVLDYIDIPFFGAKDAPAGLIGSDVLSRFGSVRLDFRAQVLVLARPEGPVPTYLTPRRSVPSEVATTLTQGDPYRLVPLSNGYLTPLVDVRIGGAERRFVLDTGAGRSSVRRSLAHSESLPVSGERDVAVSAGCTTVTPLVKSGRWSLGRIHLRPQPLLEVSLGPIPAFGLLGSDQLNTFDWVVIDYQASELLVGRGRP